ncbi:dermonecrotic toxin domain-containing protein [Pseudomonas sp. PSKL.D1]|uniref:dermonecrotic toxin domain-containing protein n=1 Tax=Pseudomonas sp. PSKL.D1 TaxID=3029060 RepID=UPI0023815B56|nr:DUF6543 domain-containing protein [Pseudomonas sp. PSKL.D1]WDY57827.1 hypothetical protein PVV54_25220 [Pseudomonas sp. PSKL.D1]
MPLDLDHFARSLASLGDARAVMEKARAFLGAWPDPYKLAHEHAAAYLLEHTGKPLDPDKVWWHVFTTASNAPTVTGWQHAGPPTRSLRFTDLLIHRFGGGFQAEPDTLPVYSGFYNQGLDAERYGANNEVALLPKDVMDYLWQLDFASEVSQREARFWGAEGLDFPALARACFLADIDRAVEGGLLAEVDRQNLRAWMGLQAGAPLTLAALTYSGHQPTLTVRHFQLGKGHLVTFQHASGRLVVYMPSMASPLRAFEDRRAMIRWLSNRLRDTDAQSWLSTLYRMDAQSDPYWRAAALQKARQQSGSYSSPEWPFGEGQALILPDLFDSLMLWVKADLGLTLHNLVSNSDLRKQLWRGYLGAFIQVFGGFSLMAWPIGLAMLGAGLARLGLDIEGAVRARSAPERTQAILASIGDSLVSAFALVDVGLGLKALSYREPPHFSGVLATLLEPARSSGRIRQVLADLDSNLVTVVPARTSGPLQGVHVDDQGRSWIAMGEMNLPVHFNSRWSSWMVLSDLDDLEIRESLLVRRGLDGQWRLYAPGGDTDGLTTQFWDTYMEPDRAMEDRLSVALLQRQTRLLERAGLPTFAGHMAPVDEFGHHYVEVQGQRFHTFSQEGELHNDLAMEYSSHMARVNDVFRGDRSRLQGFTDETLNDFIGTLADSLARLPGSRASLLWRGGRGERVGLGARYRAGAIRVGDLLVATDITSFTENPYIPRRFMLPKEAAARPLAEVAGHFDENTVLYEVVGSEQLSGAPVAPLSLNWQEAEVLFTPGSTFRIDDIHDVQGQHYRFIKFRLREQPRRADEPAFEMRSGQPFERSAYADLVGNPPWLERFFPADQWP